MYSTRHHIAYWLLSCTATATHEITSKFLPSDSLHLLLFVPSATYALHAIWKGPSNQLSTSSSRPPLLHVLTTWCLLTSLGHLVQYMHLPTAPAEGTRWIRVLIHTCLAFNILGILEPIRQNRYDVQPFSDLSTLTKPRRSNLFLCSSWAFLSIGITEALNLGLGGLSGSRVSLWVIFWSLASTLEQNFNFFSALILSWALTSLSDVAMPVSDSSALYQLFFPQSVWVPGPLVYPEEEYSVFTVESAAIGHLSFFTMYLLLLLVDICVTGRRIGAGWT